MYKKRIAICFFGQTRTSKALEQVFSKIKNVDYFVSTWDDFNNKGVFNFCINKEFIKPDIIPFTNNTHRASYLINCVNKLKKEHEKQNNIIYDTVLWTRSEILFEKDRLENFIFNEDVENNLYTLGELVQDSNENPYLTTDYSFMSNSNIFDKIALSFENINLLEGIKLPHGGHNYHAHTIVSNNLEHKKITVPFSFNYNKRSVKDIDNI